MRATRMVKRQVSVQVGRDMTARHLLTWWCLVGAAILAVACNRPPPEASVSAGASARGLSIEGVDILTDDKGFVVFYRTRTSVRDCQAQAAELPLVWETIVRPRLTDAAVREVTLFPEDSSGLSVSFTFRKGLSGEWKVPAPCSVSIPADGLDQS